MSIKIGDINYIGRFWLFWEEWHVVSKIRRKGLFTVESEIFHNFEHARIYSELIKLRKNRRSARK